MLGRMFAGPLAIVYIGVSLWGFILVSQYVYGEFGWIGVIVGIFILPIFYTIAPLYAGFSDGYWLPALVCYAPFVLMIVFSIIAGAIESISNRNSVD